MSNRELDFRTFADARAELDRLNAGCEPHGQWNLAQTCDHLAFFIEGCLDGHRFQTPWLLKAIFGRMVLKRILSTRKMKPGAPTPQKPLPPPDADEAAAVSRLRTALDRLEKHAGPFHDSPFFGHLTPEQWRELNLIHCAHHFGNLKPTT